MTPAITILKKARTDHEVLRYSHAPSASSYGAEAAEKLNLPPEQVFKTLIANCDEELVVAIIPVTHQLNTKLLARACHAKKAKMADPDVITAKTGYVLGGVSPLGQKTKLATYIDESALALRHIHVSAGKRGLEIKLQPSDLQQLCHAEWAKLTD